MSITFVTKATKSSMYLWPKHLLGTTNTPICSLFHDGCLNAIRGEIKPVSNTKVHDIVTFPFTATYLHEISKEMLTNLEEYTNSSDATEEESVECDCLPSCTSLDYEVQLSQTKWDWKEAFNVFARTKLAPDDFSKLPKYVYIGDVLLGTICK